MTEKQTILKSFQTTRDIEEAKRTELFRCLESTDSLCTSFRELCLSIDNKSTICNARDRRPEFHGRTLLHNAARLGKLPAVLILLQLGHDVDCVDSSVSLVTPLMDAIMMHHTEIASALAKAGASFFHQDMRGENILHYLARCGVVRMAKAILAESNLSDTEIQALASTASVKLRFPEDVACTAHMREVLTALRERGMHSPKRRSRKK